MLINEFFILKLYALNIASNILVRKCLKNLGGTISLEINLKKIIGIDWGKIRGNEWIEKPHR